MQNVNIGNYYRLNKGLEISDRDEATELAGILPQQSNVTPVELPGAGNVDRLLSSQGTAAIQSDWIRPTIDSPEILTPAGFSDALRGAVRTLQDTAQRTTDADSAAALSRAARDLKNLASLRDQVWASMQALLPG